MGSNRSFGWRERKAIELSFKASFVSAVMVFFISLLTINHWNTTSLIIFLFFLGIAFSTMQAFINSEILYPEDQLLKTSIISSYIGSLMIFTSIAYGSSFGDTGLFPHGYVFSGAMLFQSALLFSSSMLLFGYIILRIFIWLKERYYLHDLCSEEGFIIGFTAFLVFISPSLYYAYILDAYLFISSFLFLSIPALATVGMIENKYLYDRSGARIAALISVLAFIISYILFFSIASVYLDPGGENSVCICASVYFFFSLFFMIETLVFYEMYKTIRSIKVQRYMEEIK